MGSSGVDPQDEEHLRLLALCHYILAGLTALFGSFPLIHLAVGLMLLLSPPAGPGGPSPDEAKLVGGIFVAVGGGLVLFGWTLALLLFLGGRRLSRRHGLFFCQVVAALSCLMVPIGTVLGVFTLLVLARPGVRTLFAEAEADLPRG